MSVHPETIAALSPPDKRALLARLLTESTAPASPPSALSYGQQALWLTHQLNPTSSAYHVVFSARIRSSVDIVALQQTFQLLLNRHVALHTTYTNHAGTPQSHPNSEARVDFASVAVAAHTWSTCHERLMAEIQRPFDLERGPILRVRLFSSSSHDHLLVLTIHHIAIDFWSMGVLLQELKVVYPTVRDHQPFPLQALQVDYTDYIRWQAKAISGPESAQHRHYWHHQLAGDLPVLQLPFGRPRAPGHTGHGASHPFQLSARLTQALKTHSQDDGVTLYMTLLAALQVLLHRYTGQTDILVGSPMAGRNRPPFRQLVGYCVNPVVMRGNLSGKPTFRTFLGQIRQTVLGALRHAEYPFPLLVEQLQPVRDASRTPLFQVFLALQTLTPHADLLRFFIPGATQSAPLAFGEFMLEPTPLPQQEGPFDLTFEWAEIDNALYGLIQYSTDLFDPATIQRLAGHLNTLLSGLVANPDQPIGTLPLLTSAERHQLLGWNATAIDYPRDTCIHHLFEAQAERSPDAVAVVFKDQCLTYAEVNRRANQLAHYLQARGVTTETLVGICMARSSELLIGLLGILKAGGTYVPLDPTYPNARLTFILSDTHAPMVLTQSAYQALLHHLTSVVICLDTEWEGIAAESERNPLDQVSSDQLAYVIYTSGSTGQPKGVAITHRSPVALFAWAQEVFSPDDVAGMLAATSVCFDLSVFELFFTLSQGGTILLAEHALQLPDLPAADGVTFINTVPSAAAALLRLNQIPASVHTISLAGELLPTELVRQLYQSDTIKRVYDLYGPSEDTTYSTFALRHPDQPATIGRPIGNTQLYILDPDLQPVPIGVAGELCIGGEGLARGYLNRPALTAERFIPNPFSLQLGARLYTTGDQGHYFDNGNIAFLGRLDQQVKVHGFRIELGEIEAVLYQHPGVQEAVVHLREDRPGDQRLVAYWVSAPHLVPQVDDLQRALQEHLPQYMMPSAFVRLDVLPLTPNGKVDRRQLPAPEAILPPSNRDTTSPESQTEQVLAQLWADTLGRQTVGRDDNFFDLGGHSLLATQLVAHIQQRLQVNLPLRQLFDTPTVARLAQALDTSCQLGPTALPAANPTTDLPAEAALAADIAPATARPLSGSQFALTPQAILLTGATGFLGAYLLHELLRHTQADIYCLVRAATPEQGQLRLRHNLARYRLSPEGAGARIIPLIGDLSQPKLGLTPQRFHQLAAEIDVIYHNGSLVNFMAPYAMLKPANVLGTQDILRLASHVKVKPVHYISTTSVFDHTGYTASTLIREQDPLQHGAPLFNGYAQSKWVAEQMVREAGSRGLPISIYRPATISGHTQTGRVNTADLWCCLIKGCIQLESVPTLDIKLDWVPVDYVSQAIVHLSRQTHAIGKVFHLVNPDPLHLNQLAQSLRTYGYPLAAEPYPIWRTKLQATTECGIDNALHPFLALLTDKVAPSAYTLPELYTYDQRPQFDGHNTIAGLRQTVITCPTIHNELIETYLKEFIQTQFLQSPPLQPKAWSPPGEPFPKSIRTPL